MNIYDIGPVVILDQNENNIFDPEEDKIAVNPSSSGSILNANFDGKNPHVCEFGSSRGVLSIDFGDSDNARPLYIDPTHSGFVKYLNKFGIPGLENQKLSSITQKVQMARAEEAAAKANIPVLKNALQVARDNLNRCDPEFEATAAQLLAQGLSLIITASLQDAKAYAENGCYSEAKGSLEKAENYSQDAGIKWDASYAAQLLHGAKGKLMSGLFKTVDQKAQEGSKEEIAQLLVEGLKFSVEYNLPYDFVRAQKILSRIQTRDKALAQKAADQKLKSIDFGD